MTGFDLHLALIMGIEQGGLECPTYCVLTSYVCRGPDLNTQPFACVHTIINPKYKKNLQHIIINPQHIIVMGSGGIVVIHMHVCNQNIQVISKLLDKQKVQFKK